MNDIFVADIRKAVRKLRYNRRLLDEDEIVNEIFLELKREGLSRPMESQILRAGKNIVRNMTRSVNKASSFDPLDESLHPACRREEENDLKDLYARFLATQKEPDRTVFERFLTYSKTDIARHLRLPYREVCAIVGSLGRRIEKFLANEKPER